MVEKPHQLNEKALDAAVAAMYAEQVRRLRERVQEQHFDLDEFESYFVGLQEESVRALAVLSFSYIDSCMCELMKRHLNTEIQGGVDSLFDQSGPLNTASTRIKLCAALWWIGKNTCNDLDILRKIRNDFAHRPSLVGLEDTRIEGLLSSMTTREVKILEAVEFENDLSFRLTLHVRSILTCTDTIRDLMYAPHAIRMGLPYYAGREADFDEEPDIIQALYRRAAHAVLLIVGVVS